MLKRCLAKLFSLIVVKKIESTYNKAPDIQAKILKQLIKKAKSTKFGRDHNFSNIFSHTDFRNNVPVRDIGGSWNYFVDWKSYFIHTSHDEFETCRFRHYLNKNFKKQWPT